MSQQPLDHFEDEDGELFRHLNSVESFGGRPVTIIMLLEDPKLPFLELVDSWTPDKYSDMEYSVKEFSNYTVVDLNLNSEDKGERVQCPECHSEFPKERLMEEKEDELSLVFTKGENPVFYLITNKKSREIRNEVLDFFNRLYPVISRVGYRSADLKNVLLGLSSDLNVSVNDYVAERRYGDKTTIREHPNEMDVNEAFSKAREGGTWIDNLECEIESRRIRLSRDGRIQLYSDYRTKDAMEEILDPLIKISVEEFGEIKRLREVEEASRVTYETSEAVFTQEIGAERLIEKLNSLDKFEVGRISLQTEKPELMVKDYKSGTSYLVNVIAEDQIAIFPQEELKVISFYKLLHEISSLYEGGYTNE